TDAHGRQPSVSCGVTASASASLVCVYPGTSPGISTQQRERVMRSSIPSARRRRTSVCLRWLAAASLGGVVLGWSPSAHAEPVSGEPVTTVTFHGACGLLGLG